ncbi:Acetyltransferase (GNAT) domain-containing protein [Pustulibacterium marinum]|uniref:Acetyltransferase (GNAT) domain-containing protein n=1 Tax=Pustulibacterium marinum TaxID=1224947 RepID=A0A1I7G9P3_9FLAO|nr:GNAT family N-acetyltransferase [Pustulibacterium marinum]SFU45173.1 Acetyltransferase (GNAT) domain-containing protein [Pustulibacterium marinum]
MESIVYKLNVIPDVKAIIEVYNSSGINRPTHDVERIKKMYANSNLVITAWEEDKLVGISRSMTDFCYSCYLSDLAVHGDYQHLGIGRKLISFTQKEIGEETTLLLLSAPSAMEYYPKVGFTKAENAFLIKRQK